MTIRFIPLVNLQILMVDYSTIVKFFSLGLFMSNRAILEVNLNRIIANVRHVRTLVSETTDIMVVAKADAYGLGARKIVPALEREGVRMFGVATIEEAIDLREAGVDADLMILSEPSSESIQDIIAFRLTPTVYTPSFVRDLSRVAQDKSVNINVHLKVDTGMHRVGCDVEDAMDIVQLIKRLPCLVLEGVFSHFATAENDDDFVQIQIKRFTEFQGRLGQEGIHIPLYHMANSPAVIKYPEAHQNMVRIGMLAYDDAISVRSRVAYLKPLEAGSAVGYGGLYVTPNKTVVATVPIGYADGIPQSFAENGSVFIKGRSYPIVGRVCMDMLMVDLGSSNPEVAVEVTLIGAESGFALTDIREKAGINPRVLMCGLGRRLRRVYLGEESAG